MSPTSYESFRFEEELVKYVSTILYAKSTRISNVWDFLTKESLPNTPKTRISAPFLRSDETASSDESTTVGSGRSMSILDSFEDVCPKENNVDQPIVPTIPFLNVSVYREASSDRSNAEASGLIKESGRSGDLGACWKAWNKLIGEGGLPNEITVGCMVDALVSNQEVRQAELLVNEWKEKVRPNTVVYSTLIHGWAKQNDAKRALKVFNQMQAENVPCNAVTYNCMIHACVRVGDLQGSLDLLSTMKKRIRPDKFTYSTIIKGYCGRGDVESALILFEEMLGDHLVPDLVIYNTLLDGCVKTRHNNICDELLCDMVDKWRIYPNSYTLSILIKRFGRQGDLNKAFALVDQLPKKYGFQANAHVWTCLISACVTQGRLHAADMVFMSMSSNKEKLTELIAASEPRELQEISSALEMAALCPPDAKTYETLALGFLRYNDVSRALDLMIQGTTKAGIGRLNPQSVAQVALIAARFGFDVSILTRKISS